MLSLGWRIQPAADLRIWSRTRRHPTPTPSSRAEPGHGTVLTRRAFIGSATATTVAAAAWGQEDYPRRDEIRLEFVWATDERDPSVRYLNIG